MIFLTLASHSVKCITQDRLHDALALAWSLCHSCCIREMRHAGHNTPSPHTPKASAYYLKQTDKQNSYWNYYRIVKGAVGLPCALANIWQSSASQCYELCGFCQAQTDDNNI